MAEDSDIKYCRECGQQLQSDAKFCDQCGAEQQSGQTVAEVKTSTAPTAGTVQQDNNVADTETTEDGGLSRRQIIAGGAIGVVVAFAGASFYLGLTESNHDRVGREEAWSNREAEETDTGEIIRGRISLSEGEYFVQGFSTFGTPELGWIVQNISGGPLDVWVFSESSLESYEESADSIEYDTGLSETGIITATERAGPIGGGENWYVIFDNTNVYGAEPDGSVGFDAAMEIG